MASRHHTPPDLIQGLDQSVIAAASDGAACDRDRCHINVVASNSSSPKISRHELLDNVIGVLSSDEDYTALHPRPEEYADPTVCIGVADKCLSNKLFERLQQSFCSNHNISVKFSYAHCISHPGNLFVKNLSSSLVTEDKLFAYFNLCSKYKLLNSVKLFPQEDGELFAFLNFDLHLDADHLIGDARLHAPNAFHTDPSRKLYVSRYLSRKERKWRQQQRDAELELALGAVSLSGSTSQSSALLRLPMLLSHQNSHHNLQPNARHSALPPIAAGQHDYSTVVVENLGQFVPDLNPSVELIERVLSRFEVFGDVLAAFVPLEPVGDTHDFRLADTAYISYGRANNNTNSLVAMYYLSGLSPAAFFGFSEADIYDIKDDMADGVAEDAGSTDEAAAADDAAAKDPVLLHLSIGQHRHNLRLYDCVPGQYVFTRGLHCDGVEVLTPALHAQVLDEFSRRANYQETNVYVTNFPVLFNNDDRLWELFWLQFGSRGSFNNGVKSARIIKPQFYRKDAAPAPLGKIGFVFYEDFKMALRAILLTNNKCVTRASGDESTVVRIQTSFALQKGNTRNRSSSGTAAPASLHQGLLPRGGLLPLGAYADPWPAGTPPALQLAPGFYFPYYGYGYPYYAPTDPEPELGAQMYPLFVSPYVSPAMSADLSAPPYGYNAPPGPPPNPGRKKPQKRE
jgi:hypothetical protein